MTFVTTPGAQAELASVALDALNALKRPVGFVDHDGRAIVGNELFGMLFGDEDCEARLRSDLASADDFGDTPFIERDGRTFKIEIARLAHGALVVADDISQQLIDQENAALAARTDPESGLGNRSMFCERLTEFLQDLDPTKDAAAVLAVSLYRFKTVNTSLGRNTAKALLRLVVERFRSALGTRDILARVSDEDFAIVQADPTQPQSATALATRLVDLLSRPYLVDGHLLHIGACAGICVIPADGADCDKIFNKVDLALSLAKQDGPGKFRFFEASADTQCEERRLLESDLRRALALRELSLDYQPQFNLSSKQITGFEALLRWRHPKRGFVSPADFIPLAEELGLITPIGEWVIRTACRDAANWPDRLSVAVNVSAVQFRSASLCDCVSEALVKSGIEPQRLELEITEGVLIGDHAAVLGELNRIREMGVRVSMDDFGTGYSSLSYLHSFPFDKLKIDQSFIRGAIDEASSTAIIRAIAALSQSLGMTTTAEGVETEEQLNRVTAAGCTDIQGYLISKPLPLESVRPFLQSQKQSAARTAARKVS
jgi:diguanylate cyclase (GGDEF)-like protein